MSDTSVGGGGPTDFAAQSEQSTGGPGPFPAENTYDPALEASSGVRGDAGIFGTTEGQIDTDVVAQGRLTAGDDAGNSGSAAVLSFDFLVGGEAAFFDVGFSALAQVILGTDAAGERARGQTSFLIAIREGDRTVAEFRPEDLNLDIALSDGDSGGAVTRDDFFRSFALGQGSYTFELDTRAAVDLVPADAPAPIPLPASLPLLGFALGALGLARARRVAR